MGNKTSSGGFRIDFHKARYFGLWGAVGGAAGALLAEPVTVLRGPIPVVMYTALWFGMIGAVLALFLLLGQSLYLRKGLRLGGEAWRGAMFGGLSGLGSGAIAELIYQIGPNELLRVLCWGIAGGLLGWSLSFRIPNLGWWRGLGGGGFGGLLGGILFIVLTLLLADSAGRLGGMAAIGFFIGLMIVFAETLFRELWLEVGYGPKEIRTLSLGAEPVSFGGDAALCTVYARDAAPKACVYRVEQGQVFREDLVLHRREKIQPSDERQIGKLTVTLRGVTARAAGGPASTAQPSRETAPAQPVTTGFALRCSASQVHPLRMGGRLTVQEIPGLESADGVVAEVNQNPRDASVLGLKNLSQKVWVVRLPDGGTRQVAHGQSVRLATGSRISFGAVEAEIIAG